MSSGQATTIAHIQRLRMPNSSGKASANAVAALVWPLTKPKLGSPTVRLATMAASDGNPQKPSALPSATR